MFVKTSSGDYCNLSRCAAIEIQTAEGLHDEVFYDVVALFSDKLRCTLCVYHTKDDAQSALDRMMTLWTTLSANTNACYDICDGYFIKWSPNI